MFKKITYKNQDITPPESLNIFIAITSMTILACLLYIASHTENILILVGSAIAFSYVGNTAFALVHEAVHSVLHTNKTVNDSLGTILGAFFPTAFSFQKHCHLNHHRQNRTDFEMFEAYHEGDSKVLKTIMLYCILTGIYWSNPGLGALVLLISPKLLTNNVFSGKKNYKVGRMGGAGMLRNFDKLPKAMINRMRLEALFIFVFQFGIFMLLDLSFVGWIACYTAFAIAWSGLQYADHAYTVRDIRNGAWNLKVSKLTQAFYLNYHHHRAHHQHPNVPWIHLGKFLDDSPRPSYWKIYLRMWNGLVKIDQEKPEILDPAFDQLISSDLFYNKGKRLLR